MPPTKLHHQKVTGITNKYTFESSWRGVNTVPFGSYVFNDFGCQLETRPDCSQTFTKF